MTDHEILVNRRPNQVRVLERNGNAFLVDVNDKTVTVKIKNPSLRETIIVEIDGKSFRTRVQTVQRNMIRVKIGGKFFEVQRQPRILKEPAMKLEPATVTKTKPSAGLVIEKDAVNAPIAGRIVLLKVEVGQKVEREDCVCILEAMKMENEIAAPKAGIVKEIRVSEGAFVNKGDVLAVII